MMTASVFQDCVASSVCERRQFQRLQVAIQMEIRIEESQEPIRVETADVSISGCYVEMAMTLDVEKALNLVLWLGHKKVSIGGRVVTRHPQFGNGIEFTGALTDFREQLRCFLEGGNAVSVDGQSVPEKGLC